MASTSSCKRGILSCAKCRKQKKKCDRKLPSCSQCTATGAVCTGISARSAEDVPRSIVQHLESEIALAEKLLAQHGHSRFQEADGGAGSTLPDGQQRAAAEMHGVQSADAPPRDDLVRQHILASDNVKMFASASFPRSASDGLISRVRIGLTPSSACIGGQVSSTTSTQRSVPNEDEAMLDTRLLQSMPLATAQKLWADYMDRIQPESPFLDVEQANIHFQTVCAAVWDHSAGDQPMLVRPSLDCIVVYSILAISATLGPSRISNESTYMTLSTYLFEEGIRHFHNLQAFPSTLAWLQTLLLLLIYATVSPHSGNVWILSGAVMRTCIELGLHRDITIAEDTNTLDSRRRVFWTAYCMDRSICSALQAPLSIPDKAIDAKLPAPNGNGPFLHSVAYYQLLSEIMHKNCQQYDESPPSYSAADWDLWLADMEHRLQKWYDACRNQWTKYETLDFALSRGMMLLHRPSLRIPQPAPHSMLIAFRSAASAASYYKSYITNGFFRRPWLCAYQMFEAAAVVLFCLRNGKEIIVRHFSAAQILDMTNILKENLSAIAAQGWPEASAYGAVYERLLGSLLPTITPSGDTAAFGPAQDTELMQLLNPSQSIVGKPAEPVDWAMPPAQDPNAIDFSLFTVDYDSIWNGFVDDAELQLDFWLS